MMENPVLAGIVDMIRSLWENLSVTLQGIWSGIQTAASGAWELIKNVVLGPVLLLIDLVTGNSTKLKEDALHIWTNIQQAASTIWSGIRQSGFCGAGAGGPCFYPAVGASGFHGGSVVCGVFCGGFGLERAEKSGGVYGVEFEAVGGGGFPGDGVGDRFGAGFSGERGAGRVPVCHQFYHVPAGEGFAVGDGFYQRDCGGYPECCWECGERGV